METKNKVVEVKGMGWGGGSDAIVTKGYNASKLNRLVTQGHNPVVKPGC